MEVLFDPPPGLPDPGAEWLTLRNMTARPLRLAGWRLRDSQTETPLPTIILAPNAIALVRAAQVTDLMGLPSHSQQLVLPGRLGNGLGNSGDSLSLWDGGGTSIDAVSWGDDRTILDPPVPIPGAGISIRRQSDRDTDSASDWIGGMSTSPTPGTAQVLPQSPSIGSGSVVASPTATITPRSNGRDDVVLSEVAIAGGWVEIYNRAPTASDLLGWSLADNRNSSLTITRTMLIDGNGFVVVPMKNLDKATQLFLKRPGGSTADEAKLAPVAPDRSWGRYPAHGGVWTPGTILTPGAFNVLAAQDVPAVNVDRTEPAPEPKMGQRETAIAPRVAVLAVLLLAAIAFAARQVLWQRGA